MSVNVLSYNLLKANFICQINEEQVESAMSPLLLYQNLTEF